jgi:Ca2+-binding EF-hand superfamily protein
MRETEMLRIAFAGVAIFSAAVSTAAVAAPSEEDCKAAWVKADKDQDGDLSGGELTWYLVAIKKDGRHAEAAKDGKITEDEFMAACKDGVFEGMKKP